MSDFRVYVLDSFAVLSFLADEPFAAHIEKLLEDAIVQLNRLLLSVINLGEILYITERRGGEDRAKDTLALIRQLPIEIHPADEQAVFSAAHIKANYPISYADAFVVALARRAGGTILTGDPEFQTVEELVQIDWLKVEQYG